MDKIYKKNYQINNFKFMEKKTNNILAIFVFAYIAHVRFQKASFNSNRDIRQNVAGDGRDDEGAQNNTSRHFSKMGRR